MAKLSHARRFTPETVSGSMEELGATLARQAEAAGERLQAFAKAFREALPTDGAASLVSEGLESASSYLGGREMRDVGRDLVDLIRRYPLQVALVGAGIGYLLSRRMRGSFPAHTSDKHVKDVMTRHVEVVSPDASLKDAAAKMDDLNVGSIPVCDGERLVGILTDRDIAVRAVARGLDPASTAVRQVMSTTVRYAFEDEPVERAIETMKKHKIRRLPVLDRDKRLTGIVALGDLAVESEPQQAGDVLERVSEPARPARWRAR